MIRTTEDKKMTVKDLLSKYRGEFYIYENAIDNFGNTIKKRCIANHNDFSIESMKTEIIKKREIRDLQVANLSLNIFLEDDKLKVNKDIAKESIKMLGFTTLVENALYRKGIKTVGELCDKTYSDIKTIRCLGAKSLKQIVDIMNAYNLHFSDEI